MEFLKQKWSFWFKTMDVNQDGMITRADVDQTLTDSPNVEGLSEEEGKVADDKLEKWWNTHILKGKDTVTEEDFIKDLERQYTEDKDKFLAAIRSYTDDVISVIDVDHTGIISVDKYVKGLKSWGHNNEEQLREVFEMYKPVNGMVSADEIRNKWMVFVTNDDPSKSDIVFEAYTKNLIL